MLNTNLSDYEKYPLKVSDLIIENLDLKESSLKWAWASGEQQRLSDIPCIALKNDMYYAPLFRSPETAPYTGTVMSIDPSGRGSDETSYAVIKFLAGYQFLMEIGGYQEGYTDMTLMQMAQKAKFWGVNEIIVESNFGDGMFIKVMTPIFNKIYPCAIQEVRNTKQKELRIIDTLEPVLMQHRLIVNRSVIEDDYRIFEREQAFSFIYQMTRLCRDKNALAHDDRLDAVCMAISYWLDKMDISEEDMKEELEQSDLDMWLSEGILASKNNTIRNKCLKNIQDLRGLS